MKKVPKKIIYYQDEHNDDFSETVKNIKPLPKDYRYVHDTFLEKFLGFIAYRLILTPFGWLFVKLKYHHKFVVSKEVKKMKQGFLLYGNHTAAVADVFLPSLFSLKRKNYILAGEQARSLTKILPIMRSVGSIPLAENLSQNREMMRCIKQRLNENASVLIRPEAHVWPYYTDIRPFPSTSFKYAPLFNAPVVCMTACYQKRKFSKKPKMITYIDGPFYADPDLSIKENAEMLRNITYDTMRSRVKEHSTYAYYEYRKKEV